MFGGPLSHSLCSLTSQYLVPFGCNIYKFSNTGSISQMFELHQQAIVTLDKYSNQFISIDRSGVVVISNGSQIISSFNLNVPITSAYFHDENIIFTSQNKLFYCNIKLKKPLNKLKYSPIGQITFIHKTQKFILLGQTNQLHIFSIEQGKQIKTISHKAVITCADVWENDVAIGDQKGRIYIYSEGISEKVQQIRERHWHTGKVNSLILRDGNMMSAGEEGVVVFWHLVTQKRDFLPRFGSEILKIVVSQDYNQIYSFLSDNTVKIVHLDKDKQITHLKTVINPNGTKTKRSMIQDFKFLSGVQNNQSSYRICLNSTPGKLQFIEYSGQSSQLDITNRNTISGLDESYPNPIQVKCIAFNDNQSLLSVYADNTQTSFLKIYEYNHREFKLLTRINKPHQNGMIQMISYQCKKQITTKFMSIGVDRMLKIWKQTASKKKSLKQHKHDEISWGCQSKFSYKHRQFIGIQYISKSSGNSAAITLGDNHVIILNIDTGEIQNEIFLQGMQSSYYLGQSIAYHTDNMFAVCDYNSRKNLFNLQTLIKRFSVSPDQNNIAIVHEFQGDQLLTIIKLKKREIKVEKSYKIKNNQTIQSIFWSDSIPVAVTSSLYIIQFGQANIFTFRGDLLNHQPEPEPEQEEIETDFLSKYQSLVNRKLYSTDLQKEVNDLMETVKQLPHVGNRFRLLTDILLG